MTGNSHNSHSAGIIRSRWDYLKRISRGLIPHHTEYGALRPTSSTSDRYPFPLLYHRPTETQETSAGVMLTWIVLPRSYSPSPYLRGDLWAMKWWLQNQHAAKTISLIARCLTFEIRVRFHSTHLVIHILYCYDWLYIIVIHYWSMRVSLLLYLFRFPGSFVSFHAAKPIYLENDIPSRISIIQQIYEPLYLYTPLIYLVWEFL